MLDLKKPGILYKTSLPAFVRSKKAIKAILAGMVLVAFCLPAVALAFHNGGAGACEGCHTMHNAGVSTVKPFEGSSNWWNSGSPGTPGTVLIYGAYTPSAVLGQAANVYLTTGSDPSSTCLNCHAEPYNALLSSANTDQDAGGDHVYTIPSSGVVPHETPGGDFFWLNENYTYSSGAGTKISSGGNHGHVITASDFPSLTGIIPEFSAAPGGTYKQTYMACTSCHDPHGRVNGGTRMGKSPVSESGSYGGLIGEADRDTPGTFTLGPGIKDGKGTSITLTMITPPSGTITGNYALLVDTNYKAGDPSTYDVQYSGAGFPDTSWTYSYNAPIAWAPSEKGDAGSAVSYPGVEYSDDTRHVDYISGMSKWCANCHASYLNNTPNAGYNSSHPSSYSMATVYTMYNEYQGTGLLTGLATTAYFALVPFERGSATGETVYGPYSKTGPDSQNAQVMCLSCHRAHASPYDYDTRWDTAAGLINGSGIFMAIDDVNGVGQLSYTLGDPKSAYYGRDWDGKHGGTAAYAGVNQQGFCAKCHGDNP